MASEDPGSAPDEGPTAYSDVGEQGPAVVRHSMLRWAFTGAGCGASIGLAMILWHKLHGMFVPPQNGEGGDVGPMIAPLLPWLAFGLVLGLTTFGFLVGLPDPVG